MELKNGQYYVGDVSLTEVAEQFGTPVYVYHAEKILSQYERLKNAFGDTKVKIKYACKSLNNINVLKLLKNAGSGLDAVSIQEVWLGLHAGFKPEEILFTPNCVSIEEIKLAVKEGVQINIDNISILEQFGNEFGNTVPVCIRLNPHIMAGGNTKISTGHIDSKFGISIYQLRHVLRVVKSTNIRVNGLHMHTGSDILDSGVFLQGADILFDCAKDFPDLEFIDFGSGFKVAYKEGDITTNVEELGAAIAKNFKQFCAEYGRELELWFEPGKFLVSEAGYFLVKTNVIKQTTATVFVGVDSGQNHLIRPMFYDAYHHIVNISNPNGTPRVYTVVGYICETDTFGWDRKLNEVSEGDILCFKNAGAYGFTMSSNYNARYRPAEVMIYQGKAHLIRERESMDDILKNQVEVVK
ncbi:MAG: diaminopimelate decarboxylase [Bacteroidia bacterium]|nr:diaminopimelate decarboxylase [Bacteroidia bacterium]MBP7260175.1 diaminopimelate decarboxylase [Bacteroidia bacterium]MBP9724796.1 diaminopimelate decarboxylase [Bacteroidia bacterium]